MAANSRLNFLFPSDIRVTDAVVDAASMQGLDGTVDLAVSGQTISILRRDGTDIAPGTNLVIAFDSVRNFYAGSVGNFSLQTLNLANGLIMEEVRNLTTTQFVPGELLVQHFSLSDSRTGAPATIECTLKTTGAFNLDGIHGGKFVMGLPPGFEWLPSSTFDSDQALVLDADRDILSTNCFDAPWMKCQTLTIPLSEGSIGSELPAGTVIKMTLTGLRNSPLAKTALFHISSQSVGGRIGDVNTGVAMEILPQIVSATFRPSSDLANMTGSYDVSVDGFNVLPPSCRIVLSFPDAVTFHGDPTVSTDVPGQFNSLLIRREVSEVRSTRDPNLGVDISGNVTILRSGQLLDQNRNMKFVVSPVLHRETSGPTKAFSYSLETLNGTLIEMSAQVPGLNLTYAQPEIEDLSSTNGPSTGLTSITMTGLNYGPIKDNDRVGGDLRACSFGGSVSPLTRWVSDSSLVCVVAAGVLPAVAMVITVEGKEQAKNFSFDHPSLTGLENRNAPAVGGSLLSFFGANIGSSHLSPNAKVGLSTCETTRWFSDSAISGKLAVGVDRTLQFSVSVASRVGSGIGMVSYDAVLISSMMNATSAGGAQHGPNELQGGSYGSSSFTASARIGFSVCVSSAWVSDSVLACMPAAGVRSSLSAIVTARSCVGTISEGFSYLAIPSMAGHARSNIPSAGDVTVEMDSRLVLNADYSARVRTGDSACMKTVWISESALFCTVPAGRGDILPLTMTAGSQTGTVSQLMTYDWTQLIDAVDEHERALNMPTSGQYELTIMGVDFGGFSTSPSMRFGATAAEFTTWQSDSVIASKVASGVGDHHHAKISVLMMKHDGLLTGVASYDAPLVVLAWHGDSYENDVYSFRENTPIDTFKSVKFYGHHLGYNDFSLQMRSGITECQRSLWFSVTSLACRLPAGSRASHSVVVTVAEEFSTATTVLSYDAPTILNHSFSNLPVTILQNSTLILLSGTNFDSTATTAATRLGFTLCQLTSWTSTSSLSCKASGGLTRSAGVVITAGANVGSASNLFSYDTARITSAIGSSNNPSIARPVYIEMILDGLPREYSVATRIGPTSTLSTYWQTQTHVVCITAPGAGSSMRLVLTAGLQASSVSGLHSFDVASVFTGTANGIAKGGNRLDFSGQNFGSGVQSISIRLGVTACSSTQWLSDTTLACNDMSGISGRPQAVAVSIFGIRTLTHAFTYNVPKVSKTDRITGLDSLLMLSGNNFGTSDHTLSAQFETAGCATTEWRSDTSLQCSLRPGYSSGTLPIMPLESIRICKKCKPDEIIIGCTDLSAGYCSLCETCEPGYFRYGCVPGTDQRGACRPCQTEGTLFQRTFKPIVGNASSTCQACSICGGRNQNGSAYEQSRCSATADTICQACDSCETGVRIGCQGENSGRCVIIDEGRLTDVLGTASLRLKVKRTGPADFIATADNEVSLTGEFADIGVTILDGTVVTFPDAVDEPFVTVTAFDLTEEMKEAADRAAIRPVSKVSYFDVTGTTFSPSAFLNLRYESSEGVRIASFRWNSGNLSWTELETKTSATPAGLSIANVATDHFSAYAVFETNIRGQPDYLNVVLPIVIAVNFFICAMIVTYYFKCRNQEAGEGPANELSKRVDPSESKNFYLVTEQGPVELQVTGQVKTSPSKVSGSGAQTLGDEETSLYLRPSPPKHLPPPVQDFGGITPVSLNSRMPKTPLQRQDSRVEDSALISTPYTSVGLADQSRISHHQPFPSTRTPKLEFEFHTRDRHPHVLSPLPPRASSDKKSTSRSSQSPTASAGNSPRVGALPSYLRGSVPPRDNLTLPSTDLAMLAMGFATPARVSADASRARSRDRVSMTSPQDPGQSPDLENSLAMLAMGFTTPLRASANTSARALSDDGNTNPSQKRAWKTDASGAKFRPRSGIVSPLISAALPRATGQYSSSDDQLDDDMFGYEAESREPHADPTSTVDDVILSVGHDFAPHIASQTTSSPIPQKPVRQLCHLLLPLLALHFARVDAESSLLTLALIALERVVQQMELMEDSPERFAAALSNEGDNETEFSIQPGVRRFLPAPGDDSSL